MTVVKFNPFGIRPISTGLDDWFDSVEREFFPELFGRTYFNKRGIPAVNIIETNENYRIEVAAPGLKKGDFKIKLENHYLILSAEKKEEKEERDENYTKREFNYSSFERAFALPDNVITSQIDAKYDDGILKIYIPKKEATKEKPIREIKIS